MSMLTFDEARGQLLAAAVPVTQTELLPLREVLGRVLAAAQHAALDVPPVDNSSMDGYAVRCSDFPAAGDATVCVQLPVSQRIPAGSAAQPLLPGTAARIFTGAPLPPGADAIVMQEQCEQSEPGSVRVHHLPQPGEWIRRAGEDIARGSEVLTAGVRLGAVQLGIAASLGIARLPVWRRLRVGLLSTGNELVMPGDCDPQQLPPGHIFNSNRFVLHGLLERLGCAVEDLGSVPDDLNATRTALREAAGRCDLILSSGGVSVGEEDHVKSAVQAEGALALWKIAIKPGKPLAFGHVAAGAKRVAFIGLPGNPVASFVTFVMLVRPFILKAQGAMTSVVRGIELPAGFDWPRPDARREFLRARIGADGRLQLYPNQSSGVLTSLDWADGLIDNPPCQIIRSGDGVRFLPFSELLD
jgi:molybdopterin molybdotransferase